MAGALFERDLLAAVVRKWAAEGVLIGTSSWKYPGWLDMLYEEQRYVSRGKFARARFERNCLREYAETFRTVCVDAGFYQFPTEPYLHSLVKQVPEDFVFGFKATDEVTVKHFPSLPRHGSRAGQINPNFLNADLFCEAFLQPCAPFRRHIGVIMFEFSAFGSRDFARGRDFVEALDRFLGLLPTDWQYGVEVRNPTFLQPEYFALLRKHGITHVFNSWQRMPSILEQMALDGSLTTDFTAGRFLLKPGRSYENAVSSFSPYDQVREIYPEGRAALRWLAELARKIAAPPTGRKRKSHIFVNNRLEGNALLTILETLLEEKQATGTLGQEDL